MDNEKETPVTEEQPQTEQPKSPETPDYAAQLETLRTENATLRAQVLTGQVQSLVYAQAETLGVAVGNVPYLLKLADLTEVTKDGNVDNEKLTAALTRVLTDVPALKKSKAQENPGFQIGADSDRDKDAEAAAEENKLRRMFGLPPKK